MTLVGCATTGTPARNTEANQSTHVSEEMDGEGICNAERAQAVIGRLISSEVLQQASQLSGAKIVRALRPDQAVTKEYDSQRLNLRVDAKNIVTTVYCG
ncbi:MAG TPA: I78 family peptidase inhibitor [Eoetvoesiella sp.]